MTRVFLDTAENFHPYECNGPGKCVHCDQRKTETHDPATCALCEPYWLEPESLKEETSR